MEHEFFRGLTIREYLEHTLGTTEQLLLAKEGELVLESTMEIRDMTLTAPHSTTISVSNSTQPRMLVAHHSPSSKDREVNNSVFLSDNSTSTPNPPPIRTLVVDHNPTTTALAWGWT